MHNFLMWLTISLFLVMSWSGSVAKGYFPLLDERALYVMLAITTTFMLLSLFYLDEEVEEDDEIDGDRP